MKWLLLKLIRSYQRNISPLRPLAAALSPPALPTPWRQWRNTALSREAGWPCAAFFGATPSTGRDRSNMILSRNETGPAAPT